MRQSRLTKWTCRHIDVAGILLCVGASLLAYYAGLRPLVRQHADFAEQQLAITVQRRESARLAASVATLKEQLASTRRESTETGIELQPADQINQRISQLSELMKECGLKTDDIRLGEISRGHRCDIVPISLAGQGGYKNCAVFFNRLSNDFQDTVAASFEMSGNPLKPDEIGKFSFSLYWYTMPKAAIAQK